AVAGAAVVGTGVATLFLPRDLATSRPDAATSIWRTLDVGGSGFFAIALGALLFALKRAPTAGSSVGTFLLLGVAVGALALFVRHEARHPAPVLPLTLLR